MDTQNAVKSEPVKTADGHIVKNPSGKPTTGQAIMLLRLGIVQAQDCNLVRPDGTTETVRRAILPPTLTRLQASELISATLAKNSVGRVERLVAALSKAVAALPEAKRPEARRVIVGAFSA